MPVPTVQPALVVLEVVLVELVDQFRVQFTLQAEQAVRVQFGHILAPVYTMPVAVAEVAT